MFLTVALTGLGLAAWAAMSRGTRGSPPVASQFHGPRVSHGKILERADRVLVDMMETTTTRSVESESASLGSYAEEIWAAFPRNNSRWLFTRIIGTPDQIRGVDLVRCEPLNPRDVRLRADDADKIEQRIKVALSSLAELLAIQSMVRTQEAHDLVAAGIIQPVEEAIESNLSPAEQREYARLVEIYRARMREDPSVRNAWKSPEEMAKAKLTQNRAGETALRTDDKWYHVPPQRLVRTRDFVERISLAREYLLSEMCQWSEEKGLTEAHETVRTMQEFAAFCKKHRR